jgi:hypothetical protein
MDVIVVQGVTAQFEWHLIDDSCGREMPAYWTPRLVKFGKGHDLKRRLERHGGAEAMITGTVHMNDTIGFEILITSVERSRHPEASRVKWQPARAVLEFTTCSGEASPASRNRIQPHLLPG